MKKFCLLISICLLLFGCNYDPPKLTLDVKNNKKAKNIIIMIADGCGYNHIDATNYYTNGKLKSQIYEQFPVSFPVCTSPAMSGKFLSEKGLSWRNGYNSGKTYSDSNWRLLNVTGSGAAATAISTGRKTYNSSIGMDIYFKPLKTVAEKAKELGKSTALITSVQFSHATPASFATHNVNRKNYSEIATELIKSNVDIIFGCGHPDYDNNGNIVGDKDYQYVGGEQFWKSFVKGKDFKRKFVSTKAEFDNLRLNPTKDRILGVPQVHTTLQVAREGNSSENPFEIPFTKSIPSLSDLSLTALNSLNLNENGFFLMIEGGAVDWAAHSNLSGRMIEELSSFNKAVEKVIKWIESHSNWNETLLVVTSDHETGYLTGTNGYKSPITSNGKGNTPNMKWNSEHHTNVLIPLYAKGTGSELFDDYADELDSLRGYFIQNSEIGQVMFRTLIK